MSEWQPIETAPKDGTTVLLFCDGNPRLGRWDAKWTHVEGAFVDIVPDDNGLRLNPTHWMPLPTAPDSPQS